MIQLSSYNKLIKFTIFFIIIINWGFTFGPVLHSADAVLYALLSKEMLNGSHWYELLFYGAPWLDKPHLPFWLGYVSFKIFGVHSYSYILPGFIFYLIGGYYTYKIAEKLFDKQIALYSALLYFATFHLMLSSIDLRAESFLMGQITPAFYYLLLADTTRKYRYILSAAIFTALAMMTKGPFIIVTIGSAFAISWIITKQYAKLIGPQFILYIILTLLFITPEIFALYLQFDQHPELTVFGQHGVSGVKWFFIGSQFGRFFNTGPIVNNHGDIFYFVHTLLWSMLPYSVLFVYSLFLRYKQSNRIEVLDKKKLDLLLFAFVPTFLMFSLTKFQLDHYTNIIIPFAAIFTAYFIRHTLYDRVTNLIQYIVSCILIGLSIGISLYFLPIISESIVIIFSIFLLFILFRFKHQNGVNKAILLPVYSMLLLFITVSIMAWIYSSKLDNGYNLAKIINQDVTKPVYMLNYNNHSLALNSNAEVYQVESLSQIQATRYYVLTKNIPLNQANLELVQIYHGTNVENMMGVILNLHNGRSEYVDAYLYKTKD